MTWSKTRALAYYAMSRKTHRARARTKIVEAQLAKAQRRISRLRIEIGKLKQTAEDWESI